MRGRWIRDYVRAGVRHGQDFCASRLDARGTPPHRVEAFRLEFLDAVIAPRIGPAARALLQRHRDDDDLLVMTTRHQPLHHLELTAGHLGIEHLIATECELERDRNFTGRPRAC